MKYNFYRHLWLLAFWCPISATSRFICCHNMIQMLESIQMPAVFFPLQFKRSPLKNKDEHQPHPLGSSLLSTTFAWFILQVSGQIIVLIKHFDEMLSSNNVMLKLPRMQRKEEPRTVLMMHILHYIKAAVGKCLDHQLIQMQR